MSLLWRAMNNGQGGGTLPPIPTRKQVCGVQVSMQGLTTVTAQFGTVKWFELFLQCCSSAADRQAVYATKRTQPRPDTHQIIEFRKGGSVYGEDPFMGYVSPDYEANPQLFRALVLEILRVGKLTPIIAYDGDNGDAAADGYPNALRQLPLLYNLLKNGPEGDLNPYVLKVRFWDGVFYGSTPENITAFGTAFRQLDPDGYLGIEHNPGHIPVGNDSKDYLPGGAMDAYDVVFSEFDTSGLGNHTNNTFQVVGRMVQPYHRPPDEPGGDDPQPPFCLTPSPRGERYYCAFEFGQPAGTNWWIRGGSTPEAVTQERQYYNAAGCLYTG